MNDNKITQFRGPYNFLSNFYPCNIVYEGLTYKSVESAFQASKTLNKEIRKRFTKATAKEAKQWGKQLDLRKDWSEVKVDIMIDLVFQKFSQPYLKEKLLNTEDMIIEEHNHWRDTFWGIYNNKGKNMLGKILMTTRDVLRKEDKEQNV